MKTKCNFFPQKFYKDELSHFNYRLLNNKLCNNAYLCKCKVDVKPECRMCKDIDTSNHLVYECKNLLLIWR